MKDSILSPIALFKVTMNAKRKSEKRRPWRKIAVKANSDLYSLAKTIVAAFDFDFDHAFGFYDNLKNPYRSNICFELLNDQPREAAAFGQPQPLELPPAILKQLNIPKNRVKDLQNVMQAVQSIDLEAIQHELRDEIATFITGHVQKRLKNQLPVHQHDLLERMMHGLTRELMAEMGADEPFEPSQIQKGVKGIPIMEAFKPYRQTMCFLFDYGDDWTFEVEWLDTCPPEPRTKYPKVLESKGNPPEQYSNWEDA
jgi:Plasmid pRiA4b ORF-3-like protein